MIHNKKIEELNWWQEIVVIFWFVIGSSKFNEYVYWVEAGMIPRYAFEKADKL